MSLRLVFVVALFLPLAAAGQESDWRDSAHTAVHLLDYVGVDYPEFVKDGKVLDADEYKEQVEFAGQALALIERLPPNSARAALVGQARALAQLVSAKAPGAKVSAAASALRVALIDAYQLSVAPKSPPDVTLGARLYAQQCAGCHGVEGRGDGAAAKGLEPKPASFRDAARMAQRSVYGLYNTITLGVAGTAMPAFKQLTEDDRWALAFFVASLAPSDDERARGKSAWESGKYRETFADMRNLATLSPDEVKARFGADAAAAQQWLRAHPELAGAARSTPIRYSTETLRQSLAAYRTNDRAAAQQLAISAYLDGFELIEANLDNVDRQLRVEIEREMMRYRNLIREAADADAVERQMNRTVALLETAQRRLDAGSMSLGSIFTASLLILLREGLEAILVLAAIVAFLVKSGRRDALPWVHLGWAAALALGAVTWFVATYVVAISGMQREVTEGVTALIAAAMLVYVGLWLHSKSYLHAWQRFINDQVGRALGGKTLWAIAAVSFLAVYRELFEIVLFYEALWVQAGSAGRAPLLAGVGAAAVLLAAIGWSMFRYGLRLPIRPFFGATAVLLAALAVVFAGQGVAALQEAGVVGATPVAFVHVPALGLYPTVQTLAAQLLVVAIIALGFYAARRPRAESRAS